MIGFRHVTNALLTSLAVSLLSLIPILHLFHHSFVFLTNASIFALLRPHWPSARPAAISITRPDAIHTLCARAGH